MNTNCRIQIKENKYKVKFIYSEKATKFCEISTLLLFYLVPVKSKVALSEYMNFKRDEERMKKLRDRKALRFLGN